MNLSVKKNVCLPQFYLFNSKTQHHLQQNAKDLIQKLINRVLLRTQEKLTLSLFLNCPYMYKLNKVEK